MASAYWEGTYWEERWGRHTLGPGAPMDRGLTDIMARVMMRRRRKMLLHREKLISCYAPINTHGVYIGSC